MVKDIKRFIGTLLGSLASDIIGLTFEGISGFLHHKRHRALTKAVNVMKKRQICNTTECIIWEIP